MAYTHFHTEEHIKASGMTYTFLRDNFYADFFVALPDEEGRILGPAGDGRVGVVAREGAGRVAAGVLTDPARYENQTLDVTGPEALTLDEIAAILTRVQGRPVTYVRETIEEAYESRKKWPAAQWQYDSWVSTYTSIARRKMDVVSTTVRDVTTRSPSRRSPGLWLTVPRPRRDAPFISTRPEFRLVDTLATAGPSSFSTQQTNLSSHLFLQKRVE